MISLKENLLYFNDKVLGHCYQEVDGFYVFYPKMVGFFNEHSLRLIADFLEKLNKDWTEHIETKFGK